MKKRITSFVLAVLMVLSMALVFSVSAFAETLNYTIIVGNAYGVPGGTAQVDVFVSAKEAVADQTKLREWQVSLTSTLALKLDDKGKAMISPYTSDKDPKAFANSGSGAVGCTTNVGEDCGTIAQLRRIGGWKVGTVFFSVPDSATVGAEYPVSISEVTVFGMENDAGAKTALANQVATVAGTVTVVGAALTDADKAALKEAIKGGDSEANAKDVVIPEIFNGAVVDSLVIYDVYDDVDANDQPIVVSEPFETLLSGYYKSLTVPATVTDLGVAVSTDIYNNYKIGKLIVKNADDSCITKDLATNYSARLSGATTIDLYMYRSLSTSGATYASYNSLTRANKQKFTENYILDAYTDKAYVSGNKVTVLAGITCEVLDFESVTIRVGFFNSTGDTLIKAFEVPAKSVYTTITGFASADQDTASSQNVDDVSATFKYLTALTINGVASGEYVVKIQLVATTESAHGSLVGVSSPERTVTGTITVA